MLRVRVEHIPVATSWLLTEIAAARGRQDLHTRQSPQILKALRETAIIQSVESSNRIEGVEVAPQRLRPLVLGQARPEDRSEAELQGYREALNLIHTGAANLGITPSVIRRFHEMIQADAGDAGQWKKADNEIVELRPGAALSIRFKPVSATETPHAVDDLCRSYRYILNQTKTPPLLADALFILDFLCIHPFRDGNGRVSRLLTLLALYHHGYEVGRYVSLERLVEDAKEDYYAVLGQCSQGWHQASHDWKPWVTFYLGIIHRAYRRFEARVGSIQSKRGAKRKMVEDAVDAIESPFTFSEIERACPGVSRDMVRKVLRDLRAAGVVSCEGRGPGARWRKGNTLE